MELSMCFRKRKEKIASTDAFFNPKCMPVCKENDKQMGDAFASPHQSIHTDNLTIVSRCWFSSTSYFRE